MIVTSIDIFLNISEVECLGHLGFLSCDLPVNIQYLILHGVVFFC